ncbi:MAG: response regulator [Candidatus Zapsychrus exili]|nr:response regulator [Candidatus Zapsychrus exili]
MDKKSLNMKIIGIGLAVLYLVLFAAYFQANKVAAHSVYAKPLVAIFAALFLSAVAVSRLKEWGRLLLISANGLCLIYSLIMSLTFPDAIPPSYMIMNVIVIMFFTQPVIIDYFDAVSLRNCFVSKKKKEWKSILIVDDDPSIIKIVRPWLISAGYSVLTADTGEIGLQVTKAQKPDLIILDVLLPGIKGREVCKEIKKDPGTKDIPVVFLTDKDSAEDIKAEMEAGAHAHLNKPVNAATLISTIGNILQ